MSKEITFSWNKIQEKLNNHDIYWIGIEDYKSITLSTDEEVIMEVAGVNINQDSNLWCIDFISRDCLENPYQMNTVDDNSGGFKAMPLYHTLNTTIYNSLPQEIKNVIALKNGDKLWLPDEKEIFNDILFSNSRYDNINQYPIFNNKSNRMKGLGNDGDNFYWWESSPDFRYSSFFCNVSSNGDTASWYTSYSYGVPVCFRISEK